MCLTKQTSSKYLFQISVTCTIAVVQITITPNTFVTLNSSITLECQYTGIPEPSSIVVQWEYRPFEGQPGWGIWMYNEISKTDMCLVSEGKFEREDTDARRRHAIRLEKATMADEGKYICTLEVYKNGGDTGYDEYRDDMFLTVIGIYNYLFYSNS